MVEGETADASETAKEWGESQKTEWTSDELRGIAVAAKHRADGVINPLWKAAWMNLAVAADHLSLMLERSTVTAGEE